jgi:hypothetical protein
VSTAAGLKLAVAVAAAWSLALLGTAVQARAQSPPRDSSLAATADPVLSLPQAGARLHTLCRNAGPVQLTVRTVPAFEGVRFTFGGAPFVSNANGLARITAPECGTYSLAVERPGRVLPGVRARFARWGDNVFTARRPLLLTQPRVLEIGFEVDYLVRQTFVDLAGKPVATSRVSRVAQSNSLGSKESFVPGSPRWLAGSRIMRRSRGLQPTEILYSVREVVMNGTNVVRRAEQRFYPARTRHVRIAVLLYSAVVRARDRFFGFPLGSNIEVVYPDGHSRTFPLGEDSTIVLRSLPRGTYDVRVDAPGMSPKVPIALTRDQLVELRILSYLDLFLLFGSLGFAAVAMLLWRRPVLRRRLRAPLQGARAAAAAASSAVRIRPAPRPASQDRLATAASEAAAPRPALPAVPVGRAAAATAGFAGRLARLPVRAVSSAVRAVASFVGVLLSLGMYALERLAGGATALARGIVRAVRRAAAGAYGALAALRPGPRQRPSRPARPVAAAQAPGRAVGDGVHRWAPVGPHRAGRTNRRRVLVRRRGADIPWRGASRPGGGATAGRWAVRAQPSALTRHAAAAGGDGGIRARHRPVLRGANDA